MADTPLIKIGHLKILEHLILGISHHNLADPSSKIQHCQLEPISFESWQHIVTPLLSREICAAFLAVPLALEFIHSNKGFRVVFLTMGGGGSLVTKEHNTFSNHRDFIGKTVLVPHKFSIQHLLLHRFFAGAGLNFGDPSDPDTDVFMEVMPQDLMPDALLYDETNEIAGFFAEEPFVSKALNPGYGKRFCSSRDLWEFHPSSALVVNEHTLEQHPEAIREIIGTLETSEKFIRENTADAVAAGSLLLGQSEDTVNHAITESYHGRGKERIFPDISRLSTIRDYMTEKMNIPCNTTNIDHFVDLRFTTKSPSNIAV